jgi:trans-aconitate methyltransferase
MKGKYYHTEESVQEYIKLAKDVNSGELIEKLKELLPIDSRLLELGSGPGTDWRILNETYKVTGSDHSSLFVAHLKKSNPGGTFFELDAATLLSDLKFEGIYSNKVLHHLLTDKLKHSIRRQHAILEPKGIICHSFWKGEGSEVFKGMFVNYHNEESLTKLFEPHFNILSLEAYSEFDVSDSLVLIARKAKEFRNL